jgi:hypothetical protein
MPAYSGSGKSSRPPVLKLLSLIYAVPVPDHLPMLLCLADVSEERLKLDGDDGDNHRGRQRYGPALGAFSYSKAVESGSTAAAGAPG